MALLEFEGVGIRAIAASVPVKRINNLEPYGIFTGENLKDIAEKTGILERRIVGQDICSSDLCQSAAEKLFSDHMIAPGSIDVIIFVSQTPDYKMPATSIILQDKLKLDSKCAAFDINLGCSGFVYGLSQAFLYASQKNIFRVLLLNGETRTKVYSFDDRKTGLLFGDAGTATLIEKSEDFGKSYFSLNSDGAGYHHIMIKAGGYRNPSSIETVQIRAHEDGSLRSDEQGMMDGASVFEFTLRQVPQDIKRVMEYSGLSEPEFDYFVFHQANRFMIEHLRKRIKVPAEKVPYSLQNFGNTSSVSIPLTIVTEIGNKLNHGKHKLLISGFGVGLSWGSAVIDTHNLLVSDLVEVE